LPEQDRGEDDAASADECVFVVARGESVPVLDVVYGPFDDVVILVVSGVEPRACHRAIALFR